MRSAFLLLVALALLLAFIPFAPSFATPANAQTISVSPTRGPVGTLVTLTGLGFGNAQPFTITFDDIFVAEGVTTTTGLVSASFTVPNGAKPGSNTVSFSSGASIAFALFEVVKGAIALSVSEGVVGTGVTVNGNGFPPSTSVDVLYDGDLVATRTITTNGIFSALFSVPESVAGSHAVTARTSALDTYEAVQFKVKPSLSGIALASTGVDALITITGKGFAASDNSIAVMLGTVKLGTVASNDKGTIAGKQVDFPAFPGGTYELMATDSAGNSATASEKFTVKASMTITPTAGDVGTQVKVSGTGFQANASISLTLDSAALNPVTPLRTSGAGSFTGSFVIPKMSAGAHTITVTAGSNSFAATWTMENTPPPAPSPRSPVNRQTIGALSKQSPAFAWGEVTDPSGVTYDFQITREVSFSFPILARDNLTTTSYTLSPADALERGLYYWRVRAVDGAGNAGAWSTPWAVQIGWPVWAMVLLALLALAIVVFLVTVVLRIMSARR